jgi:hypothetical protein
MDNTQSAKQSCFDLMRKSLCVLVLVTEEVAEEVAQRLSDYFQNEVEDTQLIRTGRFPEFEFKAAVILGRPLIPVYVANFEKIREKLKGVKWDHLIR